MGAMAEAMVQYAQPLIDATDGSIEQLNKALSLSGVCFSLACVSEEAREQMLSEMKVDHKLSDDELESFRSTILMPMLQRYNSLFGSRQFDGFDDVSFRRSMQPIVESSADETSTTDRYAPCPCDSGLKYKFCCGKK